jgi:hypothetical protein
MEEFNKHSGFLSSLGKLKELATLGMKFHLA